MPQVVKNLNKLKIAVDHEGFIEPLKNNSTCANDVYVHFRNIEDYLVERLKIHDCVVGCVAWLTNEKILKSLANVKGGVSIVVQKEDFLRPDLDILDNWKQKLRELYKNLQSPSMSKYGFGELVGKLSVCGDPTISPIRCVGNHNKDKKVAFPRMHNKFLVFCEIIVAIDSDGTKYETVKPRAVWTGSFNFTYNSSMSFENAVVIENDTIAKAYFDEWQNIYSLSEELNWECDWCAPEFRIGT